MAITIEKNKLKFSTSGSADIQAAITKSIGPINELLESIKNDVDSLKSWWIGESADAFIEKSDEMREKVAQELAGWLESHKKLTQEMEQRKFANDSTTASNIRNW